MTLPRIFNPDDYLRTPSGRVFTPERNAMAWECLYAELEEVLAAVGGRGQLVVVVGVQGAGKSTWARGTLEAHSRDTIFLDAALPAKRHRTRALALSKQFHVPAHAVWIRVSLEAALRQNTQRPRDEQVPDRAIKSVFSQLEPPTEAEGFSTVQIVDVYGEA